MSCHTFQWNYVCCMCFCDSCLQLPDSCQGRFQVPHCKLLTLQRTVAGTVDPDKQSFDNPDVTAGGIVAYSRLSTLGASVLDIWSHALLLRIVLKFRRMDAGARCPRGHSISSHYSSPCLQSQLVTPVRAKCRVVRLPKSFKSYCNVLEPVPKPGVNGFSRRISR